MLHKSLNVLSEKIYNYTRSVSFSGVEYILNSNIEACFLHAYKVDNKILHTEAITLYLVWAIVMNYQAVSGKIIIFQ